MKGIDDLPTELLIKILGFLEVKEIGDLFLLCREFYRLSELNEFWESMCWIYKLHVEEKEESMSMNEFFKVQYPIRIVDGFVIPNFQRVLVENKATKYVGWERLEELKDGVFRIHYPYVYVISNNTKWGEDDNELINNFFRVHSGRGNINGVLGAKHICKIMNWEYESISKSDKSYPKEAKDKLPMMYYHYASKDILDPEVVLTYQKKGHTINPMVFFDAKKIRYGEE